ncbi:MAG: WYL domain-containing protein [Deltaproteobacteria bacterium]|jgi:predicted DNA-binding transcriptional regulator YafY|nr:WYL domain-containing protein [Deltaproteobacteria bacterium]
MAEAAEGTKAERILRILSRLFNNPPSQGVNYLSLKDDGEFGDKKTIIDCFQTIQNGLPGLIAPLKVEHDDFGNAKNYRLVFQKDLPRDQALRNLDNILAKNEPAKEHLIASLAKLNLGSDTQIILEWLLAAINGGDYSNSPRIETIFKGQVDYSEFKERFESFSKAIKDKKVCEVDYSRGDDLKSETKFFAPLHFTHFQGRIYIDGWRLRKIQRNKLQPVEERTLALHRVKTVTVLNDDFPQQNLSSPHQGRDCFGMIVTDEFILEANFAPHLRGYLEERTWPKIKNEKPSPENNKPTLIRSSRNTKFQGWYKLKMPCGDLRETLSWLLSFGSDVAIIHPNHLKEAYEAELRAIGDLCGLSVRSKPLEPKTSRVKPRQRRLKKS